MSNKTKHKTRLTKKKKKKQNRKITKQKYVRQSKA